MHNSPMDLKRSETKSSPGDIHHTKLFSIPEDIRYLDELQLSSLTSAFERWYKETLRTATRRSRARIWFIYLILRHTGARLGEVLAINDTTDFDLEKGVVVLGRTARKNGVGAREVQLPDDVVAELASFINDPENKVLRGKIFKVDQGNVRRKFYERALDVDLPKELANPTVLRRSRAIELLRNDVPLPVVQTILGHGTANLTATFVDFSDDDIKRIFGCYIQREKRKTSARNSFYGKITNIRQSDIQAEVELTTLSGLKIYSIITNESLSSLQLSKDLMATALVKAPWVIIGKDEQPPRTSARNKFFGKVVKLNEGKITAEVIVELNDGTMLCAVITEESIRNLDLKVDDYAWVMFEAFSVILSID